MVLEEIGKCYEVGGWGINWVRDNDMIGMIGGRNES